MNKQQLIKKIAKDSSRTDVSAGIALQVVLDGIADTLATGEEVKLVGFGTFKATTRAAHTAKNPATGEPVYVRTKRRVSFIAGKAIKDTVDFNHD